MKNSISIALLLIFIVAGCKKEDEPMTPDPDTTDPDTPTDSTLIQMSATPCEGGTANGHPCSGYDLLANITLSQIGSQAGNDIWGWTDTTTGKEYVLMGLDDGTAFVDITDTENLHYLGKLPTATVASSWRDIKVYNDHAFIVSEAAGHGLQVFDLTRLRDVTSVQEFSADMRLTDFGSAHNIAINEESGYAYVIGANQYQGGPVFINISDPKNPVVEGGYSGSRYTHDAQIVIYNGPDADYVGKELLIGSNGQVDGSGDNTIVIVDVTDKTNPQLIKTLSYSGDGYAHQGWLSEDHRYFFFGDELDEIRVGNKTLIRIFDFSDLDNPQTHTEYLGPTAAIDHNMYTTGGVLHLANYTAGYRALDLSQIDNKEITEKGYFDTYTPNNSTDFNGVWSVYPFFESGVIAISDINSGMFLVKASQ